MALPTDPTEVAKLIELYKKLANARQDNLDLSSTEEGDLRKMATMVKVTATEYDRLVSVREDELAVVEARAKHAQGPGGTTLTDEESTKIAELTVALNKLKQSRDLVTAADLKGQDATDRWLTLSRARSERNANAIREEELYIAAFQNRTIKTGEGLTAQDLAIARFSTALGDYFGNVKATMKTYAESMDTGLTSYTKATGLYTEALKNVQVSALGAFKDSQGDMIAYGGILREVGLTGEELGAAMQSITTNVSILRQKLHSVADREIMSQTANLIAGMKKLGVDTDVSTKNIDLFTRALKQTPTIALESIKRLDGLANSLNINVNQAISDYNTLAPTLIAYGDRSIDVFAGMQAQAQATGIAMADLDKIAQKFDTFEGAAKAAGRLNAVLGGTHLSVMELVHADPAEKFELIKQAVDDAGVAFEDMDRRQKMVIASALDMDVPSAARIFGSQEDFQMAGAAMDTSATKQDEMEKRIKKALTSTELLKKSWSELADPMRDYMEIVRNVNSQLGELPVDALLKYSDTLKDTFGLSRETAGAAAIATAEEVLDIFKDITTVIDKIPFSGALRKVGLLGIILGGEDNRVEEYQKIIDKAEELVVPREASHRPIGAAIEQMAIVGVQRATDVATPPETLAGAPTKHGGENVPPHTTVVIQIDQREVGRAVFEGFLGDYVHA